MSENESAPEIPASALDTASRLFGEIGYDGVTQEMLTASGIEPTALAAAGGKVGLYRAVMRAIFDRQLARIRAVLHEVNPTPEGICRVADTYLDFCIENPVAVALWTHRLLRDASDIQDLEENYIFPLRQLIFGAFKDQPMQTAPELLMATIVWCIHGFVARGMYAGDGTIVGIDDPAAIARMREHLHQLIRQMYGPMPSD